MSCIVGKQPFDFKQDENEYRDAKIGVITEIGDELKEENYNVER